MSILSKIKSIFGVKKSKKSRAVAIAAADIMLEAMVDGIAVADSRNKLIQANKALAELLDYDSVDEMFGMDTANLVPKREISRIMKAGKECIKKGTLRNFETVALKKDGSEVPVQLNATTLKDPSGKFVGNMSVIRDITERKKAEQQVKHQRDFLNAVVDTANIGIDVVDEKGNYILYNRQMKEITGHSQKEAQNSDFPKLLYPDAAYRAKAIKAIEAALKGKHAKNQEWEMTRKDGKKRTVLISTQLLKQDDKQLMIGAVKDITEHKKIEEKIRLFSNAIEGAIDAIVITDMEAIVTYANSAMNKLFGYKKGESIGKSISILETKPERVEQVVSVLIKTGSWNGEVVLKKKNKKTFPAIMSLSMVKDKKGNPIAMMGAIKDITELKYLQKKEKQVLKAAAVAEKEKSRKIKEGEQMRERFISDASHELRTPLAVLQTNLDLLDSLGSSKNSFSRRDFKEFVGSSKNQIGNLTTILEELSLLSRGKRPEELREEIELGAIIQEAIEELKSLAEAKDINYKVKIIDQDLKVMGDKEMLRKLVRNLISNAIRYGRKEGKIEIILRSLNREVMFQVIDNGIGISKKDLPYIFERFYRTDKGRSKEGGGVGLGLAICKWIVELHKGRIEVKSEYGEGSTFEVFLPFKGTPEDRAGHWDYKSRKRSLK